MLSLLVLVLSLLVLVLSLVVLVLSLLMLVLILFALSFLYVPLVLSLLALGYLAFGFSAKFIFHTLIWWFNILLFLWLLGYLIVYQFGCSLFDQFPNVFLLWLLVMIIEGFYCWVLKLQSYYIVSLVPGLLLDVVWELLLGQRSLFW